jgi:diadenosine tetraphosphate (Ap4A) HIT family hydrolase
VALAFNSSLAGWCVVVPTRHVEALSDLTVIEAEWLGPLLRDVSRALATVTGCLKTYVILLAEAEGFQHVHFHVVPRGNVINESRRGVNVFRFLNEEPLSDEQRDAVAQSLHVALVTLRDAAIDR